MYRPFLLALAALVLFLSPGLTHAQAPPPSPADILRARLGDTIDPAEKAYFGLFPQVSDERFQQATLTPLTNGGLRFDLRLQDATQTRDLDARTAAALATYVRGYERLRIRPVSPDLVAAQQTVTFEGVARPTLAYADTRPIAVTLRDGQTVRGWLLYADANHLVIQQGEAFAPDHLDRDAVVLRGPDVVSVQLPGVPSAGLRLIEMGSVTALQASLSYVAFERQSTTALFAAQAITTPLAAGGVLSLNRILPQSPFRVSGEQHAYLRLVERLRSRMFFAREIPPELRAWLAAQPPVLSEMFSGQTPPLRHWLHVMVNATHTPEPTGGYTREATALVLGKEMATTETGRAATYPIALVGEVEASPLRWLHVGGELQRYQTQQVVSTSLSSFQGLREGIDERTGWAAFAGLTFGDGTPRTVRSKVSVSGGAAWRQVRLRGFLYSTLAMQANPNNDPNTHRFYDAEQKGWYPYARLMYDFFLTPSTSLSLKLTYVPEQALSVDQQEISNSLNGNRWHVTQPPHTYTFSPLGISFGFRSHL